MKDEIKEILDSWNKVCNNELEYVELTLEQMRLLFNYITNLQEEVNKLTAESTEWESKCYDLQEKIKEYKMIFDTFSKRPYAHRYLEEKKKELGNNKIIGLDSEMIYKDYYDLKEKYERMKENAEILSNGYNKLEKRNEKAIEYVERVCESEKNINPYILHAPTLLNILNGDDKYE